MNKRVIFTVIAVLVIAALVLTSCATKPTTTNQVVSEDTTNAEETVAPEATQETTKKEIAKYEKPEIIQNNAEEFESNMQGDYLLLDVRTQSEYDEGNIDGATLIPVDELESRLSEISDYKDKTVLVYCRSGNRSMVASDILVSKGFTKVHNLLGGIGAWNSYKAK